MKPRQAKYGKIRAQTAPIAQWIERCPPEAKTRVRVAVGAQVLKNRSTDDVERFLSLIRFENREYFKN